MSISDTLMARYYELLTEIPLDQVKAMHPRDAKVKLACELVARFYSREEADKVAEEFNSVFGKKQVPTDLPEIHLNTAQIPLTKLLAEHDLVASLSEARRLIAQGGVQVDNEKITDTAYVIEDKLEALVKVGKRKFVKVKFKPSGKA
jgi:tyrosyl-tRNA synthetase